MRERRRGSPVQPPFQVLEGQLPAVILNQMDGKIVVKVDVGRSCHGLLFGGRSRRWRQGHPDAERVQHLQSFADFAGWFALLQIDDEPNPGSRSQGEVPLRDAHFLAGLSDQVADLSGSRSHEYYRTGILSRLWQEYRKYYRTGILNVVSLENTENIPVREGAGPEPSCARSVRITLEGVSGRV